MYGVIIMKKKKWILLSVLFIAFISFVSFQFGVIQEKKNTEKEILKVNLFYTLLALQFEQDQKQPNEINREKRESWRTFYDIILDKSAYEYAKTISETPSSADNKSCEILENFIIYRRKYKRIDRTIEEENELGLNIKPKEIDETIQKAVNILNKKNL